MTYWIDRLIRSHKTKTIITTFFTTLILIQLCLSCVAESKSEYFVKIQGSCHQQTYIRIIDESNGIMPPARSTTKSKTSPFKHYVNTISKYVFAKIDEMRQCQGNWNDPQVDLVFVYRPLVSRGIVPFNFKFTKSHNTRDLDSPWTKLTIGKSQKLTVRAAFIWNERQFLLDQVVLSDVPNVLTNSPVPIDQHIFSKFIQDYVDIDAATLSSSKEIQAAALKNLSKRVPADIMWLLLHSGNFDGILDTKIAQNKAIEQQVDRYIDLTKELVNIRFTSLQTEQRYKSVLDLKDVFNIDKYRIK